MDTAEKQLDIIVINLSPIEESPLKNLRSKFNWLMPHLIDPFYPGPSFPFFKTELKKPGNNYYKIFSKKTFFINWLKFLDFFR